MGTVLRPERWQNPITKMFRKPEPDPHVVEADVQWHVRSQLARLSYSAQRRILQAEIEILEERNNLGLTVEDGKTRQPLSYVGDQ
jgi:hypothetical protein